MNKAPALICFIAEQIVKYVIIFALLQLETFVILFVLVTWLIHILAVLK